MTKIDPDTKRCHAPATATQRVNTPQRPCGNKTKDPSGKCWRHR